MASYDFGIYFGGSSLVIAYNRDGRNEVIVNEAGDRTTPAIVSMSNNEMIIGLAAQQGIIRNAENTLLYGKYFIEKSTLNEADMSQILKKTFCPITDDDNTNDVRFQLEKNEKPFELKLNELIEFELKYLNTLAKQSLGLKDNLNVVLSVPAHFNAQQIEFLSNCAKNVGFNVQRVIHNPFAACLAYDIEEDNLKTSKVLVYQMGSCSTEITIVECINGMYRKVDSLCTFQIGGDHFTDVAVGILCEEFKRKNKQLDPSQHKRSLFKLSTTADHLKNILSTMERAHCSIDALYEGIDFDYYLTRQRFEGASTKLNDLCLTFIDDLLNKNSLSVNDIDKVIICGAATKMCKLQQLIKEKFAQSEFLNQISPDECIALGCAKQSAILSNSKFNKFSANDTLIKCIPNEIYLKVGNENNENRVKIFPKYCPTPIKRQINLNLDEQLPSVLYIYEDLNDKLLTKIELNEFTSKEINGLFQIKFDGTFEISLTELSTNKTITEYLNSES